MAPKIKFSRDKIIDVAFEIANLEGFDGISIRKVADKVGCSIAPIYVNFKDIDELKDAVAKRVQEIIEKLINEQKSEEYFLNIGIASIKFANQYKIIYRDYVLKGNSYISKNSEIVHDLIINNMKKDKNLNNFSEDELKRILIKMKIFQLGLAIAVSNNNDVDGLTEEQCITMLKEAGMDTILGMKYRKNKTV